MAKYVIEIENKPFKRTDYDGYAPSNMLYRAKGFNSLVFDKNGLDKLTPYTEPDEQKIREKAHEEAWEFILELICKQSCQLDDCFGTYGLREIMSTLSYAETKARYDKWKADKGKESDRLITECRCMFNACEHMLTPTQASKILEVLHNDKE